MSNAINVLLHPESVRSMNPKAFIHLFTENGWRITSAEGLTAYLPVADDECDGSAFQCGRIAEDELWKIFAKKFRNKEMMGVKLYWENNGPKLGLCFNLSQNCCGFPELDVTILLDENLRELEPDTGIPDYNWYIRHAILFLREGYNISGWTFESEF